MDLKAKASDLVGLETPLLVVPVFSDENEPGSAFTRANAATGNLLGQLVAEEGFKGASGKKLLIHRPTESIARVLLCGCGKTDDFKAQKLRELASHGVRECNDRKLGATAILLPDEYAGTDAVCFTAQGAVLGAYRYDAWKTQDVEVASCGEVTVLAAGDADGFNGVLTRAGRIAGGVNLARDLVNGPPVEVTPNRMAEVAQEIAASEGLECTVFDRAEIARRGMNLLLAVGAGSVEEPRFIHLTYRPEGATADTPQIALVGKGLTFDAGGYNIKGTGNIEDMKMDMAGGAAVLGAMKAVGAVSPDVIVHGIVPSSENLVSASAYKVADIVKSLNGKTVEVMNTDAEGRLILADALCYAERLGVSHIVDLATLTGACMVALGPYTAGLWSNNDGFGARVKEAADLAGEDMWPMPLNRNLKPMLKSPNADMKNIGKRWGGAITAALFLEEFVGDTAWVHLDIAGPAFAEGPADLHPAGGTGFAVMTLLELVGGGV